jgi:glucose/arabinose dehydrogenase
VKISTNLLIIGSISFLLSACGDAAKLPDQAGIGPNPTIPPPNTTLIPTVNIAAAKGWPEGTQPTPASDLAVNAYATGLDHPRWLYVLPNGDVLVAETNGPDRPEDAKGIKGFFFHVAQKWAGAGVPSANRITLLRDTDGDGLRRREPCSSKTSIRLSAWRSSVTISTSPTRCDLALPICGRRDPDRRAGRKSRGPSCRSHQSSLDQEHHRQP